jgi:transcriptional regulator GlxA family with amidase domain
VSDESSNLAGAAALLRLTARTLQRRLAFEGTSWSDLVDEARRAQVRELDLRATPDKEITFLVGFSDPSALARARARWANGR